MSMTWQLMESFLKSRAGRRARALRDLLARLEHADRHRERLRAQVRLQLAVRRLHVDHGRLLVTEATGGLLGCQGKAGASATMAPRWRDTGSSSGATCPRWWRRWTASTPSASPSPSASRI